MIVAYRAQPRALYQISNASQVHLSFVTYFLKFFLPSLLQKLSIYDPLFPNLRVFQELTMQVISFQQNENQVSLVR